MSEIGATPQRILGLYDRQMWDRLNQEERLSLQTCQDCGNMRYPPGPACPRCLSPEFEWRPVAGGAELMSWAIFHKQYLPEYPVPYNVVAIRLDEGPFMVANMIDMPDAGPQIGARLKLEVVRMADGIPLPRVRLDNDKMESDQ